VPILMRIMNGFRALFRLRRDDEELDAELREFFETAVEQRIRTGVTQTNAIRAVRLEMGSVEVVKERVREVGWESSLDTFVQDLRYAVRTLRRAPGFAAIAVGSSALGIGACSVIFAILNAALLQPLPVDDPRGLMSLSEFDRRTGEAGNELSYPDFRDLRQAQSFQALAASYPLLPASIGSQGDPQRHWGALVTASYFAVVRPRFAVGRGFDASRDDRRGEVPVVVLSHDLWRTQFGRDPGIVGRTISINKRKATVIGVTEAGFRGTHVGILSQFWIPFSMIDEIESRTGQNSENRQRHWLSALARLRPTVDAQAARAELDAIAHTLNTTFADGQQFRGFHLERAGQIDPRLRSVAATFFSLLLVATALVLLTACANIANLLLGRAAARRREIAARMALGASRGRLVRQLLTESLLLALLGGVGGWMMAAYGASLMGLVQIPLGWPLDLSISLDYRVLLFCIGLSLGTGVIFGLVPALRATRADLVTDLKVDGRGSGAVDRFGLRNGLVVAQVAICTLLLLCTGLFLRSLQTARGMDVGLSNRNLLLLAFDPSLNRRADAQARQLLRDILERAQAVPGVESATLTTDVPLTLIIDNSNFVPEESEADPTRERIGTDIYTVGPRFFETMGISFQAGDDFRPDQGGAEEITIVNDAFVRAAFPNRSAMGRRIVGDGKRLRIVGVVATAKSRTIDEAPRPSIYLPILNDYSARQGLRGVTLIVKTRDAAAGHAGALREAIRRADASLAVFGVRTMESHLGDALLLPRLAGALSTIAGCIGLAIATIGVYGVISFAVARRRREIGIRLAVGARPREVLTMVLRQGITLAFVGVVLGVLAGLGVTRFAASLLYGVDSRDTVTFVAVPVLLTAVACLACLFPARAAARLDPVDVLRSE
jgi:predicted permease